MPGPLDKGRITSYNVCYTKLLRVFVKYDKGNNIATAINIDVCLNFRTETNVGQLISFVVILSFNNFLFARLYRKAIGIKFSVFIFLCTSGKKNGNKSDQSYNFV